MKNIKKIVFIIIGVAVVVGGGAFFGGMKYGESKNPTGLFFQSGDTSSDQAGPQNFRNLSAEDRQKMAQQFGSGGAQAVLRGQMGGGAGMVAGEIISKDEQSITLKLPDGGSKIIFFSDSTDITKSMGGSVGDLKEGQQAIINGEENSDGSYIASGIRLGDSK